MRRNEPRGRLLALTLLTLGAALLAQVLGGLAGLVLLGAVVWPLPVASVMSSIISDTWASKTMSRIWAGNSWLWAIRTKRL